MRKNGEEMKREERIEKWEQKRKGKKVKGDGVRGERTEGKKNKDKGVKGRGRKEGENRKVCGAA